MKTPLKTRIANRAWAKAHPERMREFKREWREANRGKINASAAKRRRCNIEKEKQRSRRHYVKNREQILARARTASKTPTARARGLVSAKRWQLINREKHLAQRRVLRFNKRVAENARTSRWRKANREAVRAYDREYRKRRSTDLNYRARHRLRTRVAKALKSQSGLKAKKTMELIGCSIPDLIIYIESKFQSGMCWENWGKGNGKWNLDHIMPCAIFDLKRAEHQKRCFHFSNLQPLWEPDNNRKHDKVLSDQFNLL